jgi:phenylpropionate dioxygenase-like ring-hydroxylating dioxygenase large terminal subunit
MLTPEDHALLAATGPKTPMGAYLRHFWLPALLSRELPERDGTPVRVRLLSEDLIAFRNTSGDVGLMREFCAHRGASLYFARYAECAVRCWYHGWKYELDGTCTDMPNEPPTSTFKDKITQQAYPCVERNGVIWTYMGPRASRPPLPDLEWLTVPEDNTYTSKRIQQCHWTQGMEGDLDSSHLGFLHQEAIGRTVEHATYESARWMLEDSNPKIELVDTDGGMLIGSRRQADGKSYYWRINQWFAPWYTTIPAFTGDGPLAGHAWIPIDDETTWVFAFSYHPTRALTEGELVHMRGGSAIHSELIPGTFAPVHNKSNGYAAGAPDAKQPWMRIQNFQDQDVAITESMGPLYDRTQEHLGSTDNAIIQSRRRIINGAKALMNGQAPRANARDFSLRPVSVKLDRDIVKWSEAVAEPMEARPETFMASV